MIISTQHNNIFLKTAKTGSTIFEIALTKYAAAEDAVTLISDGDEQARTAVAHCGSKRFLTSLGSPQRLGRHRPEKKYSSNILAAHVRVHIGRAAFDRFP